MNRRLDRSFVIMIWHIIRVGLGKGWCFMKKATTYDVKIEQFDKRGRGKGAVWRENKKGNIGKLSLTIPYTIPGEEVTVTVADPFKKRLETKADTIIKEHGDRIDAACPHFGVCGGCSWQHM